VAMEVEPILRGALPCRWASEPENPVGPVFAWSFHVTSKLRPACWQVAIMVMPIVHMGLSPVALAAHRPSA